MSGDVVFLAHRSETVESGGRSLLACRECRNKTYLLVAEDGAFPLMQCAACGQHMGRMGWADEPEAAP